MKFGFEEWSQKLKFKLHARDNTLNKVNYCPNHWTIKHIILPPGVFYLTIWQFLFFYHAHSGVPREFFSSSVAHCFNLLNGVLKQATFATTANTQVEHNGCANVSELLDSCRSMHAHSKICSPCRTIRQLKICQQMPNRGPTVCCSGS